MAYGCLLKRNVMQTEAELVAQIKSALLQARRRARKKAYDRGFRAEGRVLAIPYMLLGFLFLLSWPIGMIEQIEHGEFGLEFYWTILLALLPFCLFWISFLLWPLKESSEN